MKQIGIRMNSSEYSLIKGFGKILSTIQIFPIELNDSELFSLLLNYAWKKERADTELRLKTGITNFNSMDNVFKSLFSSSGKQLNFMQDAFRQTSLSKTLVLDDETYSIVKEAAEKSEKGSMSETVRILVLSMIRDLTSNINILTWFLAYELFIKSCIEYTSGKIKRSDLREHLIHISIPEEISIYPYDKENFKDIKETLLRLGDFEIAKKEAFSMEKLGSEMGKNFLGNFADIASREGRFKYPKGFSAQVGMANWFFVKALPYMVIRKLFTVSLIINALKTKIQNMAPIAEIQESDILDIITEKILTNHLSLNSDYGESYRSLMKWIHGFEEHVNKHVFE